MEISVQEKIALSKYRLEKADRLIEDAALLLQEKRWESSVNRSYYATFTAAKAALILFGIDPKTHEGVKTMVNKILIIEQRLPMKYGKWLRNLLSIREDIDYADFAPIEVSDAEEAFRNSSDFIHKIKEIIPAIISQL